VLLGPEDSERAAVLLRRIGREEAPVLGGAACTHVVLARPYRTPFTFLLTFVGHKPLASLLTVPLRAWAKRFRLLPRTLVDRDLDRMVDGHQRGCAGLEQAR
jgi:hypothetical protein